MRYMTNENRNHVAWFYGEPGASFRCSFHEPDVKLFDLAVPLEQEHIAYAHWLTPITDEDAQMVMLELAARRALDDH